LTGKPTEKFSLVRNYFTLFSNVKNSPRGRKRARRNFHSPSALHCNRCLPRQQQHQKPRYSTKMNPQHFHAKIWNACNICPNK
jgi:hypothetical protein